MLLSLEYTFRIFVLKKRKTTYVLKSFFFHSVRECVGFPWISSFSFFTIVTHWYNKTNGQKDSTQIKCGVKMKEIDGYRMKRELCKLKKEMYISVHV